MALEALSKVRSDGSLSGLHFVQNTHSLYPKDGTKISAMIVAVGEVHVVLEIVDGICAGEN